MVASIVSVLAATALAATVLAAAALAAPVVAVSTSSPAVAGSVSPATAAATAVTDQLAASRVPAAAFAVVDGSTVQTGARGAGVDADTPFVLGSVSKSFTALAVVQLVDQGRVDLDAPVARYVPGFRSADADAVITVRQLLTHTSGLPAAAGLDVLRHPTTGLARRVDQVRTVRLSADPGTQFEYSNLNYAVLGRVVELVSGESFATYVETRIFAPLKMTHSHTSLADARAEGLPAGSAAWFGLDVAQPVRELPGVLPDGYLVSSASDMATYLRMQLGDGTFGDERLVSAEGLRLMHSPQVSVTDGDVAAGTSAYGFGWASGQIDGHALVAHDGDVPGYNANVALLPDDGRALVVLTARNGFFADADAAYLAGLTALTAGRSVAPSDTFERTGWIIAVASLVVLCLTAASVVRRLHRLRAPGVRRRRALRWAGGDLVLAAAVLVGVFGGVGLAVQGSPLSVSLAFSSAPDVTVVVLTVVGLVLVRGVATSVWLLRSRSGARSGPVSTS